MDLEGKFQTLRDKTEKCLIKERVAKVCFTGSTGRVFPQGSNDPIKEVLKTIPVDALPKRENQEDYRAWFEKQLEKVTKKIPGKTSRGKRLKPKPAKWGYAAKILCLFLRDIVDHCRYFEPEQAEKIRQWLYCPIDRNVIDNMKECDESLPSRIRDFDSSKKFYHVQDRLGEAARSVGVPRIWFDYVWSEPKDPKSSTKKTERRKQ